MALFYLAATVFGMSLCAWRLFSRYYSNIYGKYFLIFAVGGGLNVSLLMSGHYLVGSQAAQGALFTEPKSPEKV